MTVHARGPRRSTVLVREWLGSLRLGDTCNPANGPNGRGCRRPAEPVDEVPFDHAFSCKCFERAVEYDGRWLRLIGPNCDQEPQGLAAGDWEILLLGRRIS